jgi:hypothetical protein
MIKKIVCWSGSFLLAAACVYYRQQLRLADIPPVVWSGIAGSGLTVLGVTLTNRGLSRRHREQLTHAAVEAERARQHQKEESEIARAMQLRKDVYLPAIAGVLSAYQSISRLIDVGTPRSELDKVYLEGVAAIGKATVLAHSETVVAVTKLLSHLSSAHASLSMRRAQLDQWAAERNASANTVTRIVADQTRWTETQTQLVFTGPPPAEQWTFIQNQLKFIQGQIDRFVSQRDEKDLTIAKGQLEFMNELAGYMDDWQAASVGANIALRKELGLTPPDEEVLRRALRDGHAESKRAFTAIQARLQSVVAPPNSDDARR